MRYSFAQLPLIPGDNPIIALERPLNPNAPATSGDNTVAIPVANEWVELEFDFSLSPTPLPDDGQYTRITLIWDILNLPTEDVIYYFDDASLTAGECATVSTNGPLRPSALTVSPNPVSDNLLIEDLGNISRLDIHNLYGQRVSSVKTDFANSTYINVSHLHQGMYILTGYNSKGELLALSRFVKQ